MRDFNRSGSGSSRNFGFRGNDRPMMHQAVCDDCGKTCEVPFKPTGNKEVFCKQCFDKRGGNEGRAPRQEERSFNRFDESYGNRPGRGSSNFETGSRMMFNATCDECGKACQLPFRPSSNKPVFCSNCFKMRGERSGLDTGSRGMRDDRGSRDSYDNRGSRDNRDMRPSQDVRPAHDTGKEIRELKDQITSVNIKLEKIMKVLAMTDTKNDTQEVAAQPEKPEVKVKKVTKVTNGSIVMNKVTDEAAPVAVAKAAPKKVAVKKAADKKAVVKKTAVKKTAVKKAK